MHNFTVSGNPSISTLNANVNILERSCDSGFYHHWSSAADLDDGGGAAAPTRVAGTLNQLPPCWSLQNAATTRVASYVPKHGAWSNGGFELVVHYGTTITGGNFYVAYTVEPVKSATAVNTTALKFELPAPSATGVIHKKSFHSAELNTMSAIDNRHMGVLYSFGRIGGDALDTATGALLVYGVELIYHESVRVVGGKV